MLAATPYPRRCHALPSPRAGTKPILVAAPAPLIPAEVLDQPRVPAAPPPRLCPGGPASMRKLDPCPLEAAADGLLAPSPVRPGASPAPRRSPGWSYAPTAWKGSPDAARAKCRARHWRRLTRTALERYADELATENSAPRHHFRLRFKTTCFGFGHPAAKDRGLAGYRPGPALRSRIRLHRAERGSPAPWRNGTRNKRRRPERVAKRWNAHAEPCPMAGAVLSLSAAPSQADISDGAARAAVARRLDRIEP